MSIVSVVKFGPIDCGHVVRIEGRGTRQESPGFRKFAERLLQSELDACLVLDLRSCEYLDSTFLGCLLTLHKHFGQGESLRFVITASQETRVRLFTGTRIDLILNLTDDEPASPSKWNTVPAVELSAEDFGQHVLESHQQLAEMGGARAAAYGLVAEQLARDLKQKPS